MSDNEETFLARWSRRKLGVPEAAVEAPEARAGATHDGIISDTPACPEAAPTLAKNETSAPGFADIIDALDVRSDYSRFLGQEFPVDVRRRALRKLWASDPTFSQMDMLQDYAGDYTDKATALPSALLATAYMIGRGFTPGAEPSENADRSTTSAGDRPEGGGNDDQASSDAESERGSPAGSKSSS